MLKGWRYLGKIRGILMYQQNKRYVGVIVKPVVPPEPSVKGIYSPFSVKVDLSLIKLPPQAPFAPLTVNVEIEIIKNLPEAPFAPRECAVFMRVLGEERELIYAPLVSVVAFYPYSDSGISLPTPERVVVELPEYQTYNSPCIPTPINVTAMFELISNPIDFPSVAQRVSVQLDELDAIVKLPTVNAPERVTVMMEEIEVDHDDIVYSDYPIVDSKFELDDEGRGTPHDTYS